MSAETTSAIEAWQRAGRELGIEVVAPFRFEVEGREHECLAWLAHFGRTNGTVLFGMRPPEFATDPLACADAQRAGFQWSAVDLRTFAAFNREKFLDALLDWGFTGPEEKRPAWLDGPMAVELSLRQRAETAVNQLLRNEGLRIQHTVLAESVTVLPTGERMVCVRITLQDGSERCFDYRCDASGVGKVWPVDSGSSVGTRE